ncbi:hypothetical protein NQ317_007317 [Molorchus minor]|uniref:Uncharacterized protein n=1 Tax=Molorchus minor TaxID=1323400 RepID=A0ABQ9J882_9CUCU|nr:hypothetical protein NQ317_007317 [Molorchus minor]
MIIQLPNALDTGNVIPESHGQQKRQDQGDKLKVFYLGIIWCGKLWPQSDSLSSWSDSNYMRYPFGDFQITFCIAFWAAAQGPVDIKGPQPPLRTMDNIGYFSENAKNYKSSTLWAQYSMVKSCLIIYDNIDISKFLQTDRIF